MNMLRYRPDAVENVKRRDQLLAGLDPKKVQKLRLDELIRCFDVAGSASPLWFLEASCRNNRDPSVKDVVTALDLLGELPVALSIDTRKLPAAALETIAKATRARGRGSSRSTAATTP